MTTPAPQPVIRSTAVRRAWTSRDEAYLREHYRGQTVAQLAARLHRTIVSVQSKCERLGLHKRLLVCEQASTGEYYRLGRVADGLGVDESVVWAWIKLKRDPLPMHAHWIAGVDLAAFLARHPGVLDAGRMTAEQRRWAQALVGGNTPESETRHHDTQHMRKR